MKGWYNWGNVVEKKLSNNLLMIIVVIFEKLCVFKIKDNIYVKNKLWLVVKKIFLKGVILVIIKFMINFKISVLFVINVNFVCVNVVVVLGEVIIFLIWNLVWNNVLKFCKVLLWLCYLY